MFLSLVVFFCSFLESSCKALCNFVKYKFDELMFIFGPSTYEQVCGLNNKHAQPNYFVLNTEYPTFGQIKWLSWSV